MKYRFFLITLITFIAVSCTKHEVKELDKLGCTNPASLNYDPDATIDDGSCIMPSSKQYGFVLEYTATWCPPCGQWGAPKMHELYDMGDVVAVAAHADNDPMYNAALYGSFSYSRPTGGGIPSFWVGDEADGGVAEMTALLAKDPVGSTVCKGTISGNTMTVKTITEFMKSTSGKYYLSVLVLEDSIDGTTGDYKQEGTTDPEYKHYFVLRASSTEGEAYGEMIASGTINAGQKITKDYTITLDPAWTQYLYPVVILWEYDETNSFYKYINAYEDKPHHEVP